MISDVNELPLPFDKSELPYHDGAMRIAITAILINVFAIWFSQSDICEDVREQFERDNVHVDGMPDGVERGSVEMPDGMTRK